MKKLINFNDFYRKLSDIYEVYNINLLNNIINVKNNNDIKDCEINEMRNKKIEISQKITKYIFDVNEYEIIIKFENKIYYLATQFKII